MFLLLNPWNPHVIFIIFCERLVQVNPVGLAKPTWLVMRVISVDFAKPTGLRLSFG